MGFRGIEPDELRRLSDSVCDAGERTVSVLRPGLEVLGRHGFMPEAVKMAETAGHLAMWGTDTAANLNGRADLIEAGQQRTASFWAILRAGYAADASLAYRSFSDWADSQDRVERAVADIGRWLDQRWDDWDVTRGDLHNIRSTLTGLSHDELNRAIAHLSPRQLERWIGEMGNRHNGFSRQERRDLLDLLAISLDGAQLAQVHQAILATGSVDDVIDLGLAIQIRAPDQVIVDFVTSTMTADLVNRHYSTVAPVLALPGITGTRAIDRAIQAIVDTEGALELTVADGLTSSRVEDTGSACVPIDPLASLVQTLLRASDPQWRAATFAALAAGLHNPSPRQRHDAQPAHDSTDRGDRTLQPDDRNRLLSAATALLLADTDDLITKLATEIDPGGELVTTFLYELIVDKEHESLSRITEALRRGDVVDPARFADAGRDPHYPYPHAQNLAYLAATMTNALERYARQATNQLTAIGVMSALTAEVLCSLVTAGTLTWPTLVGQTTLETARIGATQQDIQDYLDAASQAVAIALQPSPDNSVSMPGGDLAWQLWLERFRAVTSPRDG